jgi:hypothetical protein
MTSRSIAGSFVFAVLVIAGVSAQQTQTPPPAPPAAPQTQAPPPATPPAATPPAAGGGATAPGAAAATPPARVVTPEQKAYNDATAITDMAKRLEAYRKVVADFPKTGIVRMANSSIFNTLLTWPEKKDEIAAAYRQLVGDIPATATPDTRISMLSSPITRMVEKGIVLDECEVDLGKAVSGLDKAAYAKQMTDVVVAANKSIAEANAKLAEGATKRPEREMPTQAQIDTQFNAVRGIGLEALGRYHIAAGKTDVGMRELKEVLAVNPSSPATIVLAGLEAKAGHEKEALALYLTAATTGRMKPAEESAFRALYTKVKGSDKNIEKDIDHAFEKEFPNPVKPTKYKATKTRTDRMALAEFFTGSGCPPCVASDYAFEGILERYSPKVLTALVYHVHIPAPDPMTTAASTARKDFYKVAGVPTFNVDGALSRLGGGGRDNSKMVYDAFVKSIDKSLETPAGASVIARASRSGNTINVTTTVGNVAKDAKGLTLHVVLAEDMLTFTGENGMRFHPLVVRAMAGDAKPGLPVTLDAAGRATVTHTFDLSKIPADITQSLADEIAKRRKTEPAGSTPRDYRAEGKAMTSVDPSSLVVIAFVQDEAKNVLQATRVKPGR